MLLFRHPKKTVNYDLKIKIDGKRLIPSEYVKYLGLILDAHLNWKFHVDILASKLSRATGMLSRIRHYVSTDTLRSIYFGIFSSHLTYCSMIWGQALNKNIRVNKLQNKALRIINFAHFREISNPLYEKSFILKFNDNVKLQNFILIHSSLRGILPTVMNNTFVPFHKLHKYETRGSLLNQVSLSTIHTQTHGINSIRYKATQFWNYIVGKFPDIDFAHKPKSFCKRFISNYLITNYTS